MKKEQIILTVLYCALGLGIIGSYAPIIWDIVQNRSIANSYWANVSPDLRTIAYCLWPFAIVGLVSYIALTVSKNSSHVPRQVLVTILLAASIAWSAGVYFGVRNLLPARIGATVALVLVAVCSLGLFAIEAATGAPWYVILSIAAVLPVTVLVDGVCWNYSWWMN